MKRAIIVTATSVALFFGLNAHAATRKNVTVPSSQSVFNNSASSASKAGSSLRMSTPLEGEYLKSNYQSSKGTKLPARTHIDHSIPRTFKHAKDLLKITPQRLFVAAAFSVVFDAVDWVMIDGTMTRKTNGTEPVQGGYTWSVNNLPSLGTFPSPDQACAAYDQTHPNVHTKMEGREGTSNRFVCGTYATRADGSTYRNGYVYIIRSGTSCGADMEYIASTGYCVASQKIVPVTDADFDTYVAPHITAQDAEFIRDIIKETCEGSLAPARCYEDLRDNVTLDGPAVVAGPKSTELITTPQGTAVKETQTTYNVKYGNTYYTYTQNKSTTINNPDGTTETSEEAESEEETEEELNTNLEDAYKPVIDKYESIAQDVGTVTPPPSMLDYRPWYSFGGACHNIDAELPLYGMFTFDICPYITDWVRPILGFLLFLFTWHYCYAMWVHAISVGRPI